jgi:GDPmannose 4,6-dehydratase
MLNKKVALITGITGQTGSFLAELLLKKGYRVVGIKRRSSSFNTERVDHIFNNPNFHLEYGDLSDSSCLWKILTKHKPDEIYNLAAQSHVRTSYDIPEYTADITGLGVLRMLEAYRNIVPNAKFYQASSSEMFGNSSSPQDENTIMDPASPYACAKVFGYNIVRNYREAYDLFGCNGILFNHESERRGETFVTRKITMAAAKIKLGLQDKLFLGNLDASRDWMHAIDAVEGIYKIIQHNEPDDFVLASGETHTVREFLDVVFDHAGLDPDKHVEIDERLFRPQELDLLLGDASKAKKILKWEPKISFDKLAKGMYNADYQMFLKNK